MYSVVLVLLEYRMCSYDFHTEKKWLSLPSVSGQWVVCVFDPDYWSTLSLSQWGCKCLRMKTATVSAFKPCLTALCGLFKWRLFSKALRATLQGMEVNSYFRRSSKKFNFELKKYQLHQKYMAGIWLKSMLWILMLELIQLSNDSCGKSRVTNT